MHFTIAEELPVRIYDKSEEVSKIEYVAHVFELKNRTNRTHPADHIRDLIVQYQFDNIGNKPKRILLGGAMFEAVIWQLYESTGGVKMHGLYLLDVEILLDGSKDDCSIKLMGSAEEELIKLSKRRKRNVRHD